MGEGAVVDGDGYLKSLRTKFLGPPKRPLFKTIGSWAHPGKGIEYALEGHNLVMRIDLRQNYGPSKSGKSNRIANTGGAIAVCTLECTKGYELPPYLLLSASLSSLINPRLKKVEAKE